MLNLSSRDMLKLTRHRRTCAQSSSRSILPAVTKLPFRGFRAKRCVLPLETMRAPRSASARGSSPEILGNAAHEWPFFYLFWHRIVASAQLQPSTGPHTQSRHSRTNLPWWGNLVEPPFLERSLFSPGIPASSSGFHLYSSGSEVTSIQGTTSLWRELVAVGLNFFAASVPGGPNAQPFVYGNRNVDWWLTGLLLR